MKREDYDKVIEYAMEALKLIKIMLKHYQDWSC